MSTSPGATPPQGGARREVALRLLLRHLRAAATGRGVVTGFFGRRALRYLRFAAAIRLGTSIGCTFFEHLLSPPFPYIIQSFLDDTSFLIGFR